MKRTWSVLIALAVLALAGNAHAYTCNGSGCNWTTTYTEPSTLTNGQALTDLSLCTLSYTTSKDGGAASAPITFTNPASSGAGGQVRTLTHTDATMTAAHTYNITETATCTSTAFGTSAPSAPASLLMNNGVAPSLPSVPTLQ